MTDARRYWIALVLALAACRTDADPPPPPDLSGIEEKLDALVTTLDAHTDRLSSLEGKLQTLTEESAAREKAIEEARVAEPDPIVPAGPPRGRSPDLKDPFAPDPSEVPPAIVDRTFEGQDDAIECPRESDCTIDKEFFRGLFDQEDKMMKQARIVPSQKDGKTQGYKFYGIRRGTLPKALGIKNGDMLVSVDGTDVQDVDTLLEQLTKLKKKKKFTLGFIRKGKPLELAITVE